MADSSDTVLLTEKTSGIYQVGRGIFVRIIKATYAAALEPALRPQLLTELSDAINAFGPILDIVNRRYMNPEFILFERLPGDMRQFRRRQCKGLPIILKFGDFFHTGSSQASTAVALIGD
jgi:hypothetical protein